MSTHFTRSDLDDSFFLISRRRGYSKMHETPQKNNVTVDNHRESERREGERDEGREGGKEGGV